MRIHVGETMTPIENLLPLAKAAERLGYDGYVVSDSLFYPQISEAKYTYTDEGGRNFLENKPVAECFVLAAAIGAATGLEVTTSVVKLPMRHPIYAAKLATSISALTGGRFNFGVGLSVWPEDYSVLGIGFEHRGSRMDECIEIVRGLATGKYFEYHGKFYDFPEIKINPPACGHLPILVGGHSDAALRRAARNDGWSAAGLPPEQLAESIGRLRRYRHEAGRTGPFRIFETDIGQIDYDAVMRKAEMGVSDLIVYFRNIYAVEADAEPVSIKIGRLERFAETVMARLPGAKGNTSTGINQ